MSIEIAASFRPSCERFHTSPRAGAETAACSGRRLADCAIFSGIEDQDLDSLTAAAETRRFDAGATIFRRGDPGDSVLFIRSGSVLVEADRSNRGQLALNVIPSGDLFGEIAVLEGKPRSATVTARETCELLVIPQAEFLNLLVNHPGMGIRMLGAATERLRHLTDLVAEVDASGS